MSRSAEAVVRDRAGEAPVEVALILGSGLKELADDVEGPRIPYADLPGFPEAGVSGHGAALAVGDLAGRRAAVLTGRAHYYESGRADAMRPALECLAALGARTLILTNAAGSLRPGTPPGSLMMLSDHINVAGANPLIGEPTDARFVPMADAYDPGLRAALHRAAKAEGETLAEGVYAWYSGPSFETPAEIRMLALLGADAVGMSTVPETILARYLGMRVAAISVITNMAAGLSDEAISHDHTKAMAPEGGAKLSRILRRTLADGL